MKAARHLRLLLTLSIFISILLSALIVPVRSAKASAIGPLNIVVQSCAKVTVEFYYDGVNGRMDYLPEQPRDHFRLLVRNLTCTGPNCITSMSEYTLAEAYQEVPDVPGTVSMTATWPTTPLGNGILVSVAQFNMTTSPPTMVGAEVTFYYTCNDPSGWSACDQGCPDCCVGGGAGLYPGAALFQLTCTGSGVAVSSLGVPIVQASFSQIASPLAIAIRTGLNQRIAQGAGVSLWALKSDELQVHLDSNPNASKLVVPAQICGPLTLPSTTTAPATTATQPPATGGTLYLVKPGDNLYRISLRFGRTMQAIAAANGITNINRIYAGQTLIIP